MGRAVARCADVWPPVRPAALDCVGLTLQLAARYEGIHIIYREKKTKKYLTILNFY